MTIQPIPYVVIDGIEMPVTVNDTGVVVLDDLNINWGRDYYLDSATPATLSLRILDSIGDWARSQEMLGLEIMVGIRYTDETNIDRDFKIFRGRVTEAECVIRDRDAITGTTKGFIVYIRASDKLAELGNRYFSNQNIGAQYYNERVSYIMAGSGVSNVIAGIGGTWGSALTFMPKVFDQMSALELIEETMGAAGDFISYNPDTNRVEASGRVEVATAGLELQEVTPEVKNIAPNFADAPEQWELSGGMYITPTGLDPSGYRLHVVDNAGTAWAYGPYVNVNPGEVLYGTAKSWRGSGNTSNMYLRYYFYDSAKVNLTAPNNYTGSPTASTSVNATVFEVTATVPDGAVYARLVMPITTSTGTAGFYNVSGASIKTEQWGIKLIGAGDGNVVDAGHFQALSGIKRTIGSGITEVRYEYYLNDGSGNYNKATSVLSTGLSETTYGRRTYTISTENRTNIATYAGIYLKNAQDANTWEPPAFEWDTRATGGFANHRHITNFISGTEYRNAFFFTRNQYNPFPSKLPVYRVIGGRVQFKGTKSGNMGWVVQPSLGPVVFDTAYTPLKWTTINPSSATIPVAWEDLDDSVTWDDISRVGKGI